MDSIDPIALVNEAISARNWPLLVVAVLLILTPIVLHIVGKDVPLVSSILRGLVSLFRKAPAEAPKAEEQPGVASVVKVEDEKKP